MARRWSSFEARIALPTLMAPVRTPLALTDCGHSKPWHSMLQHAVNEGTSMSTTCGVQCVHQHSRTSSASSAELQR